MNVDGQIIHQVGDGGDEAWVGAMKILKDFKLLFDLQKLFFQLEADPKSKTKLGTELV